MYFVDAPGVLKAPKHRRVRLRSHLVTLDFAVELPARWNIGVSVSTPVHADLARIEPDEPRLRAKWGVSGSVHLSREWLGPNPANLFLSTTVAIGVAVTAFDRSLPEIGAEKPESRPKADTMVATDLSLNVVFGVSVRSIWAPYIALRGFGGPVMWEGLGGVSRGSDPRHFSAALGSVFHIADRLVLGIEGAPLGAKSLSTQVGVRF